MAVMICTVVKGERWDTVERQQGAASLRDPGGGRGVVWNVRGRNRKSTTSMCIDARTHTRRTQKQHNEISVSSERQSGWGKKTKGNNKNKSKIKNSKWVHNKTSLLIFQQTVHTVE